MAQDISFAYSVRPATQVAIPSDRARQPVHAFGVMTDDLNAMAHWLPDHGIATVALERTGVYWIPVYEVLEQQGLEV